MNDDELRRKYIEARRTLPPSADRSARGELQKLVEGEDFRLVEIAAEKLERAVLVHVHTAGQQFRQHRRCPATAGEMGLRASQQQDSAWHVGNLVEQRARSAHGHGR